MSSNAAAQAGLADPASNPPVSGTPNDAVPNAVALNAVAPNHAGPTDEQLCATVAGRVNGPEGLETARVAFEELYRRYARWLLSYLVSRVSRSDLDDVAQVIWQRVWERSVTGFRGGRFQVWLFFIAKNYLIDRNRRAKVDLLASSDTSLADQRDNRPEAGMEAAERQQLFERRLKQLPKQSAAIVAGRLDGESYESICERLAISKAKAYKLFQKARVALTDWMTGSTASAYA